VSYIVVEDLNGLWQPGQVLSDAKSAGLPSNMCALPVDERMLNMGGVAGYFKRDYGEGVPMVGMHTQLARMALFLMPGEDAVLHYAARVDLLPHAAGRTGALRFATDTGQGIPSCGVSGAAPFNLSKLTDATYARGWVVRGTARARATVQGVFGFALHAQGVGFRLMWVALTQA
jgi:hypothetical protein